MIAQGRSGVVAGMEIVGLQRPILLTTVVPNKNRRAPYYIHDIDVRYGTKIYHCRVGGINSCVVNFLFLGC